MAWRAFISIILCFVSYQISDAFTTSNIMYRNEFGDSYGKEWVLFSDNDGRVHFINMTKGTIIRSRMSMGDVNFRLYTRKNVDSYEDLSEFAEAGNRISHNKISSLYFNKRAPIKLVTHGWLSSGNSDTVINIKNAYLKMYDVNVIAIDWSEIADNYFYPIAALNTRSVGKQIAIFLDYLTDHYNVDGNQLHLIGHSLGAHVMGVAAANTKHKVSRITGLDPARPLFEVPTVEDGLRLDKNDATLVDAIHTCAGILGFSDPLGHVDFYPNGGLPGQPGCVGIQALIEACSHGRSHQYFAASIESPASFSAYRCDSWDHFIKGKCGTQESVYMGDALRLNVTGTYYLFTKPPNSY